MRQPADDGPISRIENILPGPTASRDELAADIQRELFVCGCRGRRLPGLSNRIHGDLSILSGQNLVCSYQLLRVTAYCLLPTANYCHRCAVTVYERSAPDSAGAEITSPCSSR